MHPTTTDQAIAELIAERDIRNVLNRYCRGIDRIDMDLVRSCYHADATDEHGSIGGSIQEFTDHIGTSLKRHDATTHFIGNVLIDLRGEDLAFTETYCIAVSRRRAMEGLVFEHVAGLRYCDRFERRDGEWRIAHRRALMDWSKVHDGGAEWASFASYLHGTKDHTDPAYGF